MIVTPTDAIRRLLTALGVPLNQWGVTGVAVELDATGPCLAHITRVKGTSEWVETLELLDGDGDRLTPGKRLADLTAAITGNPDAMVKRLRLAVRFNEVPTVEVVTYAESTRLTAFADLLARCSAVPVVDLVEIPDRPAPGCNICGNPNCDEPNQKH